MLQVRGLKRARYVDPDEVRYRRPWGLLIAVGAFALYVTFRLIQMTYWLVEWILATFFP